MARHKIQQRTIKGYGWKRSLPDFRDERYRFWHRMIDQPEKIPDQVMLKKICPLPMDQGTLGSCVAHGVTAAMRADLISQGKPDVPLSRLQLYWDTRYIENTVMEDSGLEIRDAMKIAAKIGVAPESDWPYRIARFRSRPPPVCYKHAIQNEALEYKPVEQSLNAIKAALATGHPVVFGVSIYESFENDDVAKTGIIPMPSPTEKMLGGHCMYLHGYDDRASADVAFGRNSWGTGWGNGGDFAIPWAMLTNPGMAGDFWIITTVGKGESPQNR